MKLISICKHKLEEPYLNAWLEDEEIVRAEIWSYELDAMVELDLDHKETYRLILEQVRVYEG